MAPVRSSVADELVVRLLRIFSLALWRGATWTASRACHTAAWWCRVKGLVTGHPLRWNAAADLLSLLGSALAVGARLLRLIRGMGPKTSAGVYTQASARMRSGDR
jgi:hypothetical protein